ncbi:MAG: class II aldolase/adducin family protein [Mycobacterium sp.]
MTGPVDTVVQASRALAVAGLSDLVWGHAAVRDPEGRGVWMKAAGWGFDEVDPGKVILVTRDGAVLAGQGTRHLEFPIHTEIMTTRTDVGSVVHTHAPAINAFASLDRDLHPISHDAVPFTYPQIPRFTETGSLIATQQLGSSLAEALGEANAILMPNHGAVTVGADAASAVMYAVLLERACRTELLAVAANGPRRWSDEQETNFKRGQVWNQTQLRAGWKYLIRQTGH